MIDLSQYKQSYDHGSFLKRVIWLITSLVFFENCLPVPSSIKLFILKFFGANVGRKIVIKPNVKIKNPWLLTIDDNVWIGEQVWIDNLALVYISDNCCISQGAYLLTGSHNYKSKIFDLITKPIFISAGAWVGAKAIVCPGVTMGKLSVLEAGSVATSDLDEAYIYQGNPAIAKRKRVLSNE